MKSSKITYFYFFENGKIVASPRSLTTYEIATFSAMFGEWLFTDFS